MTGIRVGGPFKDYELVAEFFAMNAPIIFFMMSRARRLLTRSIYALLLVADIVMLFSTITRGAFISLSIGLIYMAWTCRRDLPFVRLATIASGFVALILVVDFLVARYTITGSLLGRMLQTTFESGIVPENRVLAWGGAVSRALEHPIIGHGPGWDFSKGLEADLWPHNVYLFYFNITGLFGLFAFLFLLWRLWKASSIAFGSSVLRSAYPDALLLVLNVSFFIFVIDQIKIDYPRNDLYMYFVWIVFGLIAATRNIIVRRERARQLPGPSP
jgi:O-antigen ligase